MKNLPKTQKILFAFTYRGTGTCLYSALLVPFFEIHFGTDGYSSKRIVGGPTYGLQNYHFQFSGNFSIKYKVEEGTILKSVQTPYQITVVDLL